MKPKSAIQTAVFNIKHPNTMQSKDTLNQYLDAKE